MNPKFSNLLLNRITIQEAPNKLPAENEAQIVPGTALTIFNAKGLDALNRRLVDSLGGRSHSVEVDIVESGPMSSFRAMVDLLDGEDLQFIEKSAELAGRLISVQGKPSVKDGILVLIQGTMDDDALRFILAMKAESDVGFSRLQGADGIVLQFMEQLFLTAKQKLYKVGCFVESKSRTKTGDPAVSDFHATVYDHLIKKDGEGKPASYFYHGFLGCNLKKTSKQETTKYFDSAIKAIDALKLTPEKKFEYRSGLNAYMRSPQPTVSVSKFVEDHIEEEHQDAFNAIMKKEGVSTRNIAKDTTGITSRLKTRRLKFSSGVSISGSDEAMNKSIEFLDAEEGKDGVTLRIAGRMKDTA